MNGHDANRPIPFARLHNFRDLGGYTTADGRTVRRSRLYRADSLGKLAPGTQDWDLFLTLGIRTVVDLRYPWEIEAKGRVPQHPSLTYHNQSIEHRPYDQAALPPSVAPGPYLAARYAEVAEDGTKEIRETLSLIAEAAESDAPLVFHCASGKDRTGLVAALVLSLLGVPDRTITEDFTLTERATPLLVADWRTDHPDRELVWPAYGTAPAEVMTGFLSDLKSRYGSVESYVTETLGLPPTFVQALRTHLLEPSSPSPSTGRPRRTSPPWSVSATMRPAGRSPTASTSGSRASSPNPTSAPASRRARSGWPSSTTRWRAPGNSGGTTRRPGAPNHPPPPTSTA